MTELAVSAASEKRFEAVLQHRFFLRLHMAAMLMVTLVAGILADRLLARIGVSRLAIRYFVSVVAAYAVFVSSVKLWLLYLGLYAAKKSGDWLGSFNFSSSGGSSPSSGSSSGSSSSSSSFSSGGGKFGGGGATGGWGEPGTQPAVVPAVVSQRSSSSSSKGSSSTSSGGGFDLGDSILILLIIALVLAVIIAFAWMIWAAPAILGETAFNAVLAGALAKHAHRASHGSWIGSVFKKTVLPFGVILVLATVLGWYAQYYCPGVTRLIEAVHCAHPSF